VKPKKTKPQAGVLYRGLFRFLEIEKTYNFLTISNDRFDVLMNLEHDRTKTPRNVLKELHNEKCDFARVSRALADLKKMDLCKCLNEEDMVNKEYKLTSKGFFYKTYLKDLKEEGQDDYASVVSNDISGMTPLVKAIT